MKNQIERGTPDGKLIATTTYNRDKQTVVVTRPSRGAPSWSKTMAEVQPCGHTNAQHLYHDSGDIKIDLSACSASGPPSTGQASGGVTAGVASTASAAPAGNVVMLEALKATLKAYYQLLPGIGKIACRDYANINEAPILAEKAIREAEAAIKQAERSA